MTDYCHYHQEKPALFECEGCHRLYGDCCILPTLPKQPCPVCGGNLKSLGAANTTLPFWEQINSFFQYPLQAASLGVVATSALAITAAEEMGGVTSLLLYLVVACVFTKYAYSIIQSSKDGKSRPPTFQSAFSGENLNLFFKQIAVFILAGLAIIPFALTGSEFLTVVGSFLINGLMPASIIVLALTNRIGAALNPPLLLSVVRAIGKRYILLWFFLFMLAQGPVILIVMTSEVIPSFISTPTIVLFTGYFALVMCRLLGYTVFQNQGELGFVSEDEGEEESDLSEAELQALITKQTALNSELYVKEGEYQKARKVISDRLNQQVDDVTLEDYYHRLMVVTGDEKATLKNADAAMKAFIKHNRIDLAISALNDCLGFDETFRPSSLPTTLTIAKALQSKLESNQVIRLLSGAHKRFPDDPLVADAYLIVADVLHNTKNDPDQAKKYLAFVKKQFPDQANHPKLVELAASLS